MDYDFAILDPHDESEDNVAALTAWVKTVSHGFHEGTPGELPLKIWLDTMRADDQRVSGAWLPAGEFGAGPNPVATFTSFDKTLNAGLELVDLHMITDVTVSPAHRRQGLLRRLMVDDLAQSTAPVAALTVSEASIYGRFGFGAATFRRHIEVETTPRFAWRTYADKGRVEMLEPADMWPVVSDLFERFHATTRGSVARHSAYRAFMTGEVDPATGSPATKLRGAVHLSPAGEPDGYVQWQVEDYEPGKPTPLRASLLALGDEAHLGLWQFLAGIDLTQRVVDRASRLDDVLDWSLTNADLVSVKDVYSHIWIRVLDVPRALAARPWFADDSIVLGVDDPLGHAGGAFRIDARDGRAVITSTTGEPDVSMSAETLGSLYLGGVAVGTLARAGRVTGSSGAVARLAALMDGGAAPYGLTSF
ncbi:GNAT family N-acetyltransferase [Nocardioides piscis]|uniref:GNAT family N-acetyltransferase n=1 Tax=Nocardioides piscis TaxID=2714938 RepID=A0A6G7YCU4_9ACTN|nr:GNAT family N-acetyltransferase [Nocardioides piscis]QIK74496.1 GNAT family N-acetyltransferase [Nocardioides piscis]